MAYAVIKDLARRAGLYRQARWVHCHVLDRSSLRRFRAELAFYSQFIRSGHLCFDVGANYGLKTEVFSTLGGRVVAFEPQPDCIAELRARVPSAVALCTAVGSSPGRATLHVDRHRTGSSMLSDWRPETTEMLEVPVTTLDLAIDTYGLPNFCKIDVEGLELDVLLGLSRRIPMISFEFTRRRLEAAIACLHRLEQFGLFEANFTPEDEPRLLLPAWLRPGAARAFVSGQLGSLTDCVWGDAIVRFDSSG